MGGMMFAFGVPVVSLSWSSDVSTWEKSRSLRTRLSRSNWCRASKLIALARHLESIIAFKVANLAPRTIRGLESNGMILFAEDRDGALKPVVPHGEPGAVVR